VEQMASSFGPAELGSIGESVVVQQGKVS
jgi:hypothetical protein